MRVSVLAAIIISAAIPAQAFNCTKASNTCLDIGICLRRGVDNDVRRIKEGVRTNVGHLVWEGADACWTNFNDHRSWAGYSGGCSDDDFLNLAKAAIGGDQNCPQ